MPGGTGPDTIPGEPDPKEVEKLLEWWRLDRLRRAAEAAARGVRPPPPPILPPWVVYLFLIIALILLIYAIYNWATTKPYVLRAGPMCSLTNAASNLGPYSASAVFQNQTQLLNQVMSQAQTQCDKYASQCPSAAPCASGTCKPNVSLQEFDISDYGVYRRVTIQRFNCTCECLP